jgi:hypothetical protein
MAPPLGFFSPAGYHVRQEGFFNRLLTWEKAGEANFPADEVLLQVLDAGSGREAVDAIAITTDGRWTPPVF